MSNNGNNDITNIAFNLVLNKKLEQKFNKAIEDIREEISNISSNTIVLVGEQGLQGEKGDRGEPGLKGDKGEQGPIGFQGPIGRDGKDGKDGKDGQKGDQGLKGDKGDAGEKGDKGDQGLKGDKGDTGEKGEKGDKGDTGAKGETGPEGKQGDTGPKGEKGERGERGIQGVPGLRGIKGDKGDRGEKGDKGDIGPQGPAGKDGSAADNIELEQKLLKIINTTKTDIDRRISSIRYASVGGGSSGGGAVNLYDQDDVDFNSVKWPSSNGSVLTYDTSISKWVSSNTLSISNTTLSILDANGDVAPIYVGGGQIQIGTNTVIITSNSISISNTSTSIEITNPPAGQDDGTYFLSSNGQWLQPEGSGGGNGSGSSNAIISSSQSFIGNGSNSTFTLERSSTSTSCLVTQNGLIQNAGVDYTITGTLLTFSSTPFDNSVIEVIHLRNQYNTQVISGVNGQTSYQLNRNLINERDAIVTINGLVLALSIHYNISNNILTFTSALETTDIVTVIYFDTASYDYITFKITNASTSSPIERWYSPSTITVDSIDMFTSTPAVGNLVVKIYKHNDTLNSNSAITNPLTSNDSFIIEAGNYRLNSIAISNTSITSFDYIYYQVTSGQANNLVIRLRYK